MCGFLSSVVGLVKCLDSGNPNRNPAAMDLFVLKSLRNEPYGGMKNIRGWVGLIFKINLIKHES
jgi:hypothetical protein